MKIVVNKEYIEKLVRAYRKLGFIFSVNREDLPKSGSIKRIDNSLIKISYLNENQDYVCKKLDEINATDAHAAYMYSNKIAESRNELIANNEAFLLLFNYMSKEDIKLRINERIFRFLKENPDFVEETDRNLNDFYSISYADIIGDSIKDDCDFVLDENVNKNKKNDNDDIDVEKLTKLIIEAMKEDEEKEESMNNEENKKASIDNKKEEIKDTNTNNTQTTDFVLVNNEENANINNNIIEDNNKKEEESTYRIAFKQNDRVDYIPTTVNKTYEKPQKREKVVQFEENKHVADKARKKFNWDALLISAGVVILAGAIGYAGYYFYKNNKDIKDINNNTSTEETTNINTEDDVIKFTPSSDNSNEEEIKNNETEEVETVEEVEEVVEETIDPQSDEFIEQITDKITENIHETELGSTYSKEDIRNIVLYAHHSYDGFNGENKLSNETAYEIYTQFVKHGIDISHFYEGLKGYEDLHNVDIALKNVVQELGKYDDEYNAYKAIETTLNNMDENNFTEAVALRAYTDLYTIIPSMQVAMGGAKENGEEGQTYYNEKASIDEAKVSECKNIYNEIDVNNQNAKLTRIVLKALDEDDALIRTR